MKIEKDSVKILSGIRFGKTLGSPIALLIENKDWKNWLEIMKVEETGDEKIEPVTVVRPGHADFSASLKYQYDDVRNAIERASARETAIRVALCTVVRKLLEELRIFIGSHVVQIGKAVYPPEESVERIMIELKNHPEGAINISKEADKSEVRIISPDVSKEAIEEIKKAKKNGDTLGGVFEIIVGGAPAGLGSHVHYDRKIDAAFASSVVSINGVKAVEIGDGFVSAGLPGSEVHDEIFPDRGGEFKRKTNRAGGIEGGITNGEDIIIRGYMKPIATLMKPLRSVDLISGRGVVTRRERSDFCAVPACSVIGEAVVAPVIANAFLEKYGGDTMEEITKNMRRIQ